MFRFSEIGPFRFNDVGELVNTSFAWNRDSYLIFIDQPLRVGYSFALHNETIHTDRGVGKLLYEVMVGIYHRYPFLLRNEHGEERPLYLTGESYAGHYIPAAADEILKHNREGRGSFQIPLLGVAIGNGLTDALAQYSSYIRYMRMNGLITQEMAERRKPAWQECKDAIRSGATAVAADKCVSVMQKTLTDAETHLGRTINYYNWKLTCDKKPFCYHSDALSKFLGRADVKSALGVPPSINWKLCSNRVHDAFNVDPWRSSVELVKRMLDANVTVVIYAGVNDILCNWYEDEFFVSFFKLFFCSSRLSNRNWVRSMNYGSFNSAPRENLLVDGRIAGHVTTDGHLTFATIFDAGHMVKIF